MGFKRPFDDQEFPELPFKHHRQLECGGEQALFGKKLPSDDSPQKHDLSRENKSGFNKFQWREAHLDDIVADVSIFDKDFETSAPLSWVTSSSRAEDVGFCPDYFEFNFPRRTLVPFDDINFSLSDRSPRKQVPIGPNHQANVPLWSEEINENKLNQIDTLNTNISRGSVMIDDDNEDQRMGTCVIPMPDLKSTVHNGDQDWDGRMDCLCLDGGSVRCVQLHIMEEREKLRKSLGHEKFANLGFYDMGEEVASRWSEEVEHVFHEVVFSNPASTGKNFWKHLSTVFPSRTKKELVSYYFNVFMLQRRAAQNRSNLLDIDSDDDEWHESIRGSLEVVREEDEDSAIESLVDQDDHSGDEEGLPEKDGVDDDSDDDDNNDDGSVGNGREDSPENDSGIDHLSEAHIVKSFDNGRLDHAVQHVDKIPGTFGEDFDVQDDSCMSFECPPNMADSCGSVNAEPAVPMSGCLSSKIDGSRDGVGHMYFLDSCDAEVWDARYPTDPIKDIDLLPTCNIIEEIFGLGSWDNKTKDN